jgi:hypothetical protein
MGYFTVGAAGDVDRDCTCALASSWWDTLVLDIHGLHEFLADSTF